MKNIINKLSGKLARLPQAIKDNAKKPLAVAICTAVVVSSVGATVWALTSGRDGDIEAKETVKAAAEKKDVLTKDETVYVLAGSDGSVQKIIVSDWIKNELGKETITDKSELSNVENTNGDESYTMNGDNMRVWDAEGNDIYYQGDIKKELPVGLSITYTLDGKSISADELAGKSGHVTIRFDYQNNQYERVSIDGKNEKIYVPFAMLTGILLDNEVFTNVDVSNGKLINDGGRTAVVGIAFPGLQENLDLSKDDLEIPDYVEISADVTKFELNTTVTIATNELFNQIDESDLDSLDKLSDAVNDMTAAMNKLTDGSSQLYEGLCTLLDKSSELIAGINSLAEGAEQLKNGSDGLVNGSVKLQSGAAELAAGLKTLTKKNDSLVNGAKKTFDTLLAAADSQLEAAGAKVPKLTVSNYATVLNGLIESLDEKNVYKTAYNAAYEQVKESVKDQRGTVKTAVTSAVQDDVTEKVLKANGMTVDEYEEGVANGTVSKAQQAAISAAVEEQMNSETIKALIEKKTDEQMETLIEQNMNSPEVQSKLTAALKEAKSSAATVSALKEQLDSYNSFYNGLKTYTTGVSSAKKGADKLRNGASDLKDGSKELNAGMSELYDGILTLKNGAPALVEGVTELRDGSMTLSNGLKEFNEKGIKKLSDAVNGKLNGLMTRLKATVDVSKDYKNFSGVSDDMDGQVKFIYRTESVK